MKLNFQKARAHIESAEIDLSILSPGQKCDLLLDNMPEIQDSAEAKTIIMMLGHPHCVQNYMLKNERLDYEFYYDFLCGCIMDEIPGMLANTIKYHIITCIEEGNDMDSDSIY